MKQWPLNKAYFWESAPFFRLLLPVITGICCYDYKWLPAIPVSYTIIPAAVLLAVFIATLFIRQSRFVLSVIGFVLINFILFFSSYALCYYNDIRNNAQWFGNHLSQADAYTARIAETPVEKDKTWKLTVDVLSNLRGDKVNYLKGKAFLYIFKGNQSLIYSKGDTILIPNQWQPVKNPGNPFEFDYARYCARNNIYYQQFLPDNKLTGYAAANPKDVTVTEQSHEWCIKQLDRYIADSVTKGLIQAMLLGDEVNLDQHLFQAYADTGIVHIIAISGSNVTIFFLVISALLWWLKNKKYAWVKYMIALPLVWFYVIMAGAPPSAIRAAAMFSILAVGFALQKENNSLNTLFAAAVLLLLAQPMWLFSLGFQLSFIAVLSLILFYSPIYKLYLPKYKITKALWATIAASIAAEVLVAPLVVYYFHLFPLFFVVANAAAYLFMGIVLILGMLIIALSCIPVVATALAWITTLLATWFHKIVYVLQNLNPTSFHYLHLSAAELVVLYIVIAGIAAFILQKKKPALFVSLPAACLLMLFFCKDEYNTLHQQRLVFYNINKANHIELITGRRYHIWHTDTGAAGKKDYVLKPAHTEWHAWRGDSMASNKTILEFNKNSVLYLDKNINTDQSFHIDYLIVGCDFKEIDISRLQQIFSPKLMVIGNTYTRRQLDKLAETCKEQGVPVHIVAYDGAFIL